MAPIQSMRDEPGTQREYETIYIVKPDSDSTQIQTVNERIKGIIEDDEGKPLVVENWGKRKLAYEIKKQQKGIYLYWRYLGKSSVVAEIERNLRMIDSVIRFLTVKVDADVDPNARPSDVNEDTFVQAATTRPDEEDLYLGRGVMPDASKDDSDSDTTEESDSPVEAASATSEDGEEADAVTSDVDAKEDDDSEQAADDEQESTDASESDEKKE